MNLFFICRIIWALNFYFPIIVCSLKNSTLFVYVDSASSGEKQKQILRRSLYPTGHNKRWEVVQNIMSRPLVYKLSE